MLRLGGSFSFLQQDFTIRFGSRSERSTFAYPDMYLMIPKLHHRSLIKFGLQVDVLIS
ncbi:unnamed protein product [Arabidopsis halleri]